MRKLLWFLFFFTLLPLCPADIFTVDDNGPADFNTIQAAINAASYGDTINVATGTYIENITLKNGVALIGQDPNLTIIDGNSNGSVVYSENCDPNTTIQGFTITNGSGTLIVSFPRRGGGMYNYGSSPTVKDCNFINNSAHQGGGICNHSYSNSTIVNCSFNNNTAPQFGGGIYNKESNPTVTNCNLSRNSSINGGGGIYNNGSSPIVTNCNFIENSTTPGWGGGMCNYEASSPTVTNCTFFENISSEWGGGMCNFASCYPKVSNCKFSKNSAEAGGGMFNLNESGPIVTSCTFMENAASKDGGGMLNSQNSNPIIEDCVFSDNSAFLSGGGIFISLDSIIHFTNCIFTGNSSTYGGGIFNDIYNNVTKLTNCTISMNSASHIGGGISNISNLTLINCILWANNAPDNPQVYNYSSSYISITYSDVQGGWAGIGNIDADPIFADTNIGDFHLQSQAGRWDPNTQSWVIDSNTSPCIDAGDWMTPIGLEPFPNGGRINMGAYGGTEQASKSYFGKPSCQTIIAGDINGDCIVDLKDFSIMALHWLEETS